MNSSGPADFWATHFSSDRVNPYALAWECALDGKVMIHVPSGTILDCNPAAESLTHIARVDVLGKTVLDLIPREERLKAFEILQQLELGPTRIDGFHVITSDQKWIPVMIATSGVIDLGEGFHIAILEYQDVSVAKEQEHRLATKRWALSAYASAAITLSGEHSRSSLLSAICEAVVTEPNYVFAWIALAENDEAKSITLAAQAGAAIGIMDGIHLNWSADDPDSYGPTPVAIRTGKLQTVDDTREMTVHSPWTERFNDYGIRSCASIPFRSSEGHPGAIVVCSNKVRAFEPVALEVFTHLAEQLGYGLRSIVQQERLLAEHEHAARADRQLFEAMSLMMQPMSLAMEMRDPYTAGHQNRVAEISVAIATEMGWSSEKLAGLRLAALVHDLGKMAIPAEILSKPGHLSPNERALLNEHCAHSYNILKGIPFVWPIADIVLQHHEKLDGSGYPNGLTAEKILPEAKVLVVADMFEAMTAHRPYRPGIPVDRVLEMLQAEAGTKLDPEAVRICASLCRAGTFQHLFSR